VAPTNTATPAPVKHKKHKAAAAKKPASHSSEPAVVLAPGQAEVNATDLTVRGQAGLKGEMVTHLHKGDTVTVLEQINLSKHEAGEPSQWAKISFPTNAQLWVDSKYIKDGVVSAKKLNLRAGHGENYSVVGVIEQGTQINAIETKGNWIKIAPPAGAYAFVAARYLTQIAGTTQVASSANEAPESAPTPPAPAPTPTQVTEQPQIVTQPPAPSQPQEPPQPTVRIVQHEGVVGTVGSPIAPSTYKLYDPQTKEDIDFLYPISGNVDLSKFVDDRVIVTGEEGIDKRWPNTPIIAIQSIDVVEQAAIKRFSPQDLRQPRQRH
jgi:uncharacterized protein YgiM (DUF1202 family)